MSSDQAIIVKIPSRLDAATCRLLRKELFFALESGRRPVIVDLSERPALNHDDIDLLLSGAARVAGRDLQLVVVAGSPANRTLLEVSRLAFVLPVFISSVEALTALSRIAHHQPDPVFASNSVRPQEHPYDSHRA